MSTYVHIIKQALPVRKGEKKGVKDIQQASVLEGAHRNNATGRERGVYKARAFPTVVYKRC